MKFTAPKSTLIRALNHVVPVSDAKSTMPVLANVHLVADEDKLHGCLIASATNLDITATTDESVSVDTAGALCLPARALLDRVKAMPDAEITFEAKGTAVTLKAKGSARKFTLHGIPGEEFPSIPELTSPDWSLEMPAVELAELLAGTAFSISTDETRLHLNSLCLETLDGAIRGVSTDGHRLSLMTIGEMPARIPTQMLVPRGGIMRLKSLIDGSDKEVRLARCGKNLWVTSEDKHLCLKLADAQFPPYDQVIPKQHDVSVELNRVALLGAVKAVRISAPTSQGMKLELSKNKLKLATESADGGEGADEIECVCSASRTYGVNSGYLVDALDAMSTETIVMKMSGELDPIVIEPLGATRAQVLVLMPMRI
jgi:DNA polymerase III subunit beta